MILGKEEEQSERKGNLHTDARKMISKVRWNYDGDKR